MIDADGGSWSAAVGGESYTCDVADVSVKVVGSIEFGAFCSSAVCMEVCAGGWSGNKMNTNINENKYLEQ